MRGLGRRWRGRSLRVVPGRRVSHHAGRWSLITPAVGPILGAGPTAGRINRPDGFASPDSRPAGPTCITPRSRPTSTSSPADWVGSCPTTTRCPARVPAEVIADYRGPKPTYNGTDVGG